MKIAGKLTVLLLLSVLLSAPVLAQSDLVVWKKSGGTVTVPVSSVGNIEFKTPEEIPDGSREVNGHQFVDLGLPSGLLWATCNIGASTPAEAGSYFAWGETATKTTYSTATSVWRGKAYPASTLKAEDDAATVNWGAGVRMPTSEECVELCQNADWVWTDDYEGSGMGGRIVTSKTNGNSIFIPAAGAAYESGIDSYGKNAFYWTADAYSDDGTNESAWDVYYYSDWINPYIGWIDRYYGMPVRAVAE